MFQSIPLYFYIPVLVFFLVIIIAIGFLRLSRNKRPQIEDEFSFRTEQATAYPIPEDYGTMSPTEKRLVTIQNLHLNYGKDAEAIAGLLELNKTFVEEVLVKSRHLHKT